MQILFFGTEYWLALDSFLCFERSVIHFIQPTSSWPDGLILQPPRDNRTPVPSPLSVIQSPVLLQDSIVDKVRTLHPATCAIKHALPQQSPVSSLQSPGLQYSVIEVIHLRLGHHVDSVACLPSSCPSTSQHHPNTRLSFLFPLFLFPSCF